MCVLLDDCVLLDKIFQECFKGVQNSLYKIFRIFHSLSLNVLLNMPMGMKIDNGIAVALFSTVYNSQTKIKPGLKHPLRRHQNI